MRTIILLFFACFLALPFGMLAQQNPQYTQYMYNTQVINPAYAGNREVLSFGLLYRDQWVGLEGAPKTATFTADLPMGKFDNMGLGFSLIHDEIGIETQTDLAVDYSYSVYLNYSTRLNFGVKAGLFKPNIDYSKLNLFDPNDPKFQNNTNNHWQRKVGAGVYLNSDRWYVGLSVPNFLKMRYNDQNQSNNENTNYQSVDAKRMHFYFIGGYVFDLSYAVKFKPATMVKVVEGAPLQWDVSANFLFHQKLTLGAAWRWDAALSAMAGFQVSPGIFIGVGYDYQLTDLETYSDGSYEVILRFDVFDKIEKVLTPRFF